MSRLLQYVVGWNGRVSVFEIFDQCTSKYLVIICEIDRDSELDLRTSSLPIRRKKGKEDHYCFVLCFAFQLVVGIEKRILV